MAALTSLQRRNKRKTKSANGRVWRSPRCLANKHVSFGSRKRAVNCLKAAVTLGNPLNSLTFTGTCCRVNPLCAPFKRVGVCVNVFVSVFVWNHVRILLLLCVNYVNCAHILFLVIVKCTNKGTSESISYMTRWICKRREQNVKYKWNESRELLTNTEHWKHK